MVSPVLRQTLLACAAYWQLSTISAFTTNLPQLHRTGSIVSSTVCFSQASDATTAAPTASNDDDSSNKNNDNKSQEVATEEEKMWYEIPEEAVIRILPRAMKRLNELRVQQQKDEIHLRMGVKSGGCSGMSYVMDFCEKEDITDDDVVDTYASEHVQCVVDPKSVLYLYGLELDYSTELIGGGFKFFNSNAEESCGCGSSFSV